MCLVLEAGFAEWCQALSQPSKSSTAFVTAALVPATEQTFQSQLLGGHIHSQARLVRPESGFSIAHVSAWSGQSLSTRNALSMSVVAGTAVDLVTVTDWRGWLSCGETWPPSPTCLSFLPDEPTAVGLLGWHFGHVTHRLLSFLPVSPVKAELFIFICASDSIRTFEGCPPLFSTRRCVYRTFSLFSCSRQQNSRANPRRPRGIRPLHSPSCLEATPTCSQALAVLMLLLVSMERATESLEVSAEKGEIGRFLYVSNTGLIMSSLKKMLFVTCLIMELHSAKGGDRREKRSHVNP